MFNPQLYSRAFNVYGGVKLGYNWYVLSGKYLSEDIDKIVKMQNNLTYGLCVGATINDVYDLELSVDSCEGNVTIDDRKIVAAPGGDDLEGTYSIHTASISLGYRF